MGDEATPMTDERLALARQHSRRLVRALVLEIDRLRSLASSSSAIREAAAHVVREVDECWGERGEDAPAMWTEVQRAVESLRAALNKVSAPAEQEDEATSEVNEIIAELAYAPSSIQQLARAALIRQRDELSRLRSLATEATGLREAATRYLPYAEHSYGCAVRNRHSPDCDCGLAALRDAVSSSAPSEDITRPTPQEGEPA